MIMSHAVSFYLIDIEKIRNIIDEKDLSILKKMKIDGEDRRYIKTLLVGDAPACDDELFEYGYALEKIVRRLYGKNESVPEFEDLRFGEFDDPPLDWIIQSSSPVTLPPNKDFPYIGHRFCSEMRQTLDAWDDDMFDNFEPEIQKMIEGMFSVFQTAIEKKKDLITFYY
ncbi:hypothetical protein FACS189454_07810 [Planctomycetales bacterium]|nr:hypothetical protein FACS189454_07810 [Planctomycetales bacterium]